MLAIELVSCFFSGTQYKNDEWILNNVVRNRCNTISVKY